MCPQKCHPADRLKRDAERRVFESSGRRKCSTITARWRARRGGSTNVHATIRWWSTAGTQQNGYYAPDKLANTARPGRARTAAPGREANHKRYGSQRLHDHQGDDDARNALFVAALVERIILSAGQREERVMDHLHEPDDACEHRGDERVR